MDPLSRVSAKSLPPELLAQIFRLTCNDEYCLAPDHLSPQTRHQSHTWLEYPKQPDRLAHICSTWRRIALTTSSLWSHIDIAIDHQLNPGLFARAKVYAQRAGRQPLEIHLCDPGSERQRQKWLGGNSKLRTPLGDFMDLHEFKFLDTNTAHIRSLILDVLAFSQFRRAHFSALEYFITKCATGALTHYITRVHALGPSLFVEATENQHSPRLNLLQLPKSRLEEQWRYVNVVDVNGLCPRWSSKLYHGLVDLRLGDKVPEITEYQIVSILKASPGLRILHLKNQITLEVPEDTEVKRIQLSDLEVLNIEDWDSDGFDDGGIIRWIQPGVKPLRFTFFGAPTTTVAEFFERSNVTRFYSKGWEPFTLVEMLRLAPRLQTLVLNAFDLEVNTIGTIVGPINEERAFASFVPVHIDTLYLLGFKKLELDHIQEAVDRYSVRRIYLWACVLACSSHAGNELYEDATAIRQKLSEVTNCPAVEYLTGGEPIDPYDWE